MIWYLDHSAIAVETNNHLLLFDLFGKTLQPPKEMGLAQGFVNPDELRDKDVVIFVSHEHPDHFDPAIFSLRDRLKRVRFVLPEEFDEIYQGDLFAAPNQTYRLPDMTVTTFESTDIGLAYLVEVDDKRIYHAGDLNWWHWEGEEEEFNLDQAKRVTSSRCSCWQMHWTAITLTLPASRWTRVYTATACADCWRLTAECLQKTSFPSTSGEIFR